MCHLLDMLRCLLDIFLDRGCIGGCVSTLLLDMQVTLHIEIIVMQVTLHYDIIVMQVTLHNEAKNFL